MIHSVKVHGIQGASHAWITKYDTRVRSGEPPSLDHVINGKLLFARMVAGPKSPKYRRHANAWAEVAGSTVYATVQDDIDNHEDSVQSVTHGYKYDLAISFASEQKDRVDSFVQIFERAGLSVFYAPRPQASARMIGEELPRYFESVFGTEARRCIIFASEDYGEKVWTGYERQVIIDTFVKRRAGYVWPIMFDDVKIEGLPGSIGHMSPSDGTDEEIALAIVDRLMEEKEKEG